MVTVSSMTDKYDEMAEKIQFPRSVWPHVVEEIRKNIAATLRKAVEEAKEGIYKSQDAAIPQRIKNVRLLSKKLIAKGRAEAYEEAAKIADHCGCASSYCCAHQGWISRDIRSRAQEVR